VPALALSLPLQALAGTLTGQGLLAGKTVCNPGQRGYSAVTCTEQAGCCWGC
jgi:hypothetical protein